MPNTIGDAYIQIVPTTDGIQGSLEKALGGEAEKAGKSVGGKLGAVLGGAAKVGLGAVTAATGAVTAFGKASVDAGKTFDSSMSQVAATMGYTTEELNTVGTEAYENFNKLSNFAQQMGATTAFSASQAADALNYMALAGYDTETSMAMLPNVLDLAAAGGIDLAAASDMVTDAQSALGLSIEETNDMVNMMAKASSKSNTSVAQLGDALLTIGATGRDAAGGTKELATMLGVMADNGIKGTEGGTHLRNIMLSLGQHANHLKESLDIDVYDENGSLRDMTEIFTEMDVAMSNMTDAEKTEFLTHDMFNKTDLAAVNALLGTQAERYEELGNAIGDAAGSTAASDMAKTQLDNLEGDITLFQSALEGVQIQVSNMLTPTMREFVQLAGDGLGEIASALQNGDIEGAFSHLGEYLGAALTKVVEMLPEMLNAAKSLLGALGQAIFDNLPELMQIAIDIVTTLATDIGNNLPTIIPMAVDMILTLVDGIIDNIDMIVDGAIALVVGLAEGLMTVLPTLLEKAPEIVAKLVVALIENAPKIFEASLKIIASFADGIRTVIPQLIKLGPDLIAGLWNGIKNAWPRLIENLKSMASQLITTLKTVFKIGSPSKILEDEVGQWLPEGIAVGINDTADSPVKALTDMSENMTSTLQTELSGNIASPVYNSPELSNSESKLYDLMNRYAPEMGNVSVNVSLEGDAEGLFKSVKTQNKKYAKQHGRSAFT